MGARLIAVCLCLFVSSAAVAWNHSGHQLVAQIAYDNLTPQVKKKVNTILKVMYCRGPKPRFVCLATWPDKIKAHGLTRFDKWHYINLPYAVDETKVRPVNRQNVVWAINTLTKQLQSPGIDRRQQARKLVFLIHFFGDIHQPLHSINRFSAETPEGDRGGNLYPIVESEGAKDIHHYWDRAGGYFYQQFKRSRLKTKQLQKIAQIIEQAFPKAQFDVDLKQDDPMIWAEQSRALAAVNAYMVTFAGKPSDDYRQTVQQLSCQQIALAGYRLAQMLNRLYG